MPFALRTSRHAMLPALLALSVGATLSAPETAVAQGVGLDPHVVIVDGRTRAGSFTLVNPSPKAVEATITVQYGLSQFDSTGHSNVVFPTPDASSPNAAPFMIYSPRRVLLAPGQIQEVRFRANPPAGTKPGEYWARVAVVTQPVEPPANDTSSDVRVALRFITRATMPLFFRLGEVKTGLVMSPVVARVVGDSVTLTSTVTRTGNGAYLGTVHAEARSSSGATIDLGRRALAVYTAGEARWSFPRTDALRSGSYTVTIRAVSERPDLPPGAVISAPTVTQTASLQVP